MCIEKNVDKATEFSIGIDEHESVLTNAAYLRPDGIYVVPLTGLKG